MHKLTIIKIFTLSSLLVPYFWVAAAAPSNLTRILTTPYSDGAWSRGVHGITMATSLKTIPLISKKTNFDNEILNDENNFIWQTVELTKGLFWPLDVHASYSYNNQTKLLKWHGMLQYSFFQKAYYPTLAIRTSSTSLKNKNSNIASSNNLSVAFSWGYRSLNIFGSAFKYIVTSEQKYRNEKLDSIGSSEIFGFQYNLNPFSKISISKTWEKGDNVANELKFSVGL